jgi:hypothetical protein
VFFLNDSSHSRAASVLQAILLAKGTVKTALNESNLKWDVLRLVREKFFENGSIPEHFLSGGSSDREDLLFISISLISDALLDVIIDTIDPGVSDTVRELFLLSPEDFRGNGGLLEVEGLSENVLFNLLFIVLRHFNFRVDAHDIFNESSVQEGRSYFNTPSLD